MPNITQIQVGTTTYDIVDIIARSTSLPIASSTTLGGVKIGEGLSITNDGIISVTSQSAVSISVSSEIMYFTFQGR